MEDSLGRNHLQFLQDTAALTASFLVLVSATCVGLGYRDAGNLIATVVFLLLGGALSLILFQSLKGYLPADRDRQ